MVLCSDLLIFASGLDSVLCIHSIVTARDPVVHGPFVVKTGTFLKEYLTTSKTTFYEE